MGLCQTIMESGVRSQESGVRSQERGKEILRLNF